MVTDATIMQDVKIRKLLVDEGDFLLNLSINLRLLQKAFYSLKINYQQYK